MECPDAAPAQPHGRPGPAVVGAVLVWCLLAAAYGFAATWLLFAAASACRVASGLSVPGAGDWLPGTLATIVGMVVGHLAGGSPSGRSWGGLWAAVAVALAALVGSVASTVTLARWWPALVAHALGVVAGVAGRQLALRPGRIVPIVVAAAASVAAALLWPLLQRALGIVSFAAVLAVTLAALVAACASPGPLPLAANPLARRSRAEVAVLGGLSLVVVAWSAPRELWLAPAPGAVAVCFAAMLVTASLSVGSAPRVALLASLFGAAAVWLEDAAGSAVDGRTERVLAADRGAAAVYQRATQELQLVVEEVVVDAAGPDRNHAQFVAVLLGACLVPGDRTLLVGLGVGRLPGCLQRAGVTGFDVADARPEAMALLGRLQADGPVPPSGLAEVVPAGVRRSVAGVRAALARLPAASRRAVVVAEPLHALASAQVHCEVQAELRRVAGTGYVLQPFTIDRTPPALLRALFGAAAATHAWNGVFVVGNVGVLLSAAASPAWCSLRPLASWSEDARWLAHAAHVGDLADLQRACLGTVAPPAVGFARGDAHAGPAPEPAGRTLGLAVLHELLQPLADAPPPDPDSLLSHWQARQAEQRRVLTILGELGDDAVSCDRAQALAAGLLHVGAPAALLQAALGLPARDGVRLLDPSAASLRAQAIDPTFFLAAPPVCASLPRPRQEAGELEDFAHLPDLARLAELAQGDAPQAVALRARFPSACARAFVAALAVKELPPAANQALRELADPFVLAEAGRALRGTGRIGELLSLWRGDLAMPDLLRDLMAGGPAERRRLAAALARRSDPRAVSALAELLADADVQVREAAGAALAATAGGRIPYDPRWPRSALLQAADRVRSLHNRAP